MLSCRSNQRKVLFLFSLSLLILSACSESTTRYVNINDNKKNTWTQNNWLIDDFYKVYRANDHVEQVLKKAQPYLPYIHKVFRHYKLPPQLAYLPMLESSFNAKAVSRTGATGLWQFKKATAVDNGLRVNRGVDDRLNWKKSTWAAAQYLNKLGKRFNYNWELALAGYNGGPTYISKKMKQQHTWNFWNLKLRKEPHQYVPRFLAMIKVARQKFPDLYYVRF